ncbi:carboxypeptidase B [Parasteatoda tepidariorum]|uniref:carboxypeptidase B n=1 Tax=Parasteatoda tepidariorum TaxID=114398 RepID=UPI00077F8D00|nr:carboxypeptidase B [Parasteatoda tepidariorum]
MTITVCFKIFVIILILTGYTVCQRKISYRGYSLIRITPVNQQQLQYLLNMTAIPGNGLDFWLQTTAVNKSADVMVAPSVANSTTKNLNRFRIPYKILMPDVGKVIEDDLKAEINVPSQYQFYGTYPSLNEICQYIGDIASSYPDITSLIDIGSSFEGRTLEILKVSTESYEQKPVIWIQGGVHAREQIGPAVVTFIADMLTSLYDECDEVNDLVEEFDWYFLPVLNPDGYYYCQTKDRLWRKTRSRDSNIKHCVGVDANRNWDIKWNSTGSSPRPCSHTYAGSKPFSEPEVKAVSDFMTCNLKDRIAMFVDFHSYSQRWLTPWGYTSKLPPTYPEQKRLAEVGIAAIKRLSGSTYTVGSSGNHMYTVSGGERDWVTSVIGAKYSYVVELQDLGQFGFLLPRRQILPNAQEAWEGIKAMATDLLRLESE